MTEETIFEGALEKRTPAERSAYLAEACRGDAGLRRRVEALLASHDRLGNFLDRPAVKQLAAAAVTGAEQPGREASTLDFLQPSTKPGSLGRLAHYEALEVLGQGGCGIVLKAFDEKLHRVVAIKVMAPQLASTSPPRKRFLREARSAAAIRHENVVGIHAVEDQPIPYLVMEYIAGETLQQRLDRSGPIEVAEVLRIGQQVASGLAAAHALGLIHRDVKPANILLENGAAQRVKLTDFGLARAADDASLTQSGVIAGTPLYMAPEQAQGEVIDQRADLFSLGSVLYVLCSGRPPFRASTTLAVLKRVAEDTPRPIRELVPEVPNWLCTIVARLHAKKPADRFASAQEVADLLARHLAKLQQDRGRPRLATVPPAAQKPAPPPPAPVKRARPKSEERPVPAQAIRPPRPRRRRWTTAAAVLLLLFAGLSLSEATGVTNVRGTVIRLFSSEGTLVVEVDDPNVSVTLDDGEMVIRGAGIKELRLKPGQYKVLASKDGKLVRQELVTVTRNGRQVVRVSKEAGPAAGPGKDPKSDAAPGPAAGPLDLKYIPAAASAAFVVSPRRILQSSLAATALPPTAAAEMARELGVQPEQVEQVIVLLQVGGVRPAAAPPPKDAWSELDSKEGRFSLRFPVEAKPSDRKTSLGTRKVFAAEVDEGKMTFEVSYVDFPKDSPFVGDQSRVDFGTRVLEFKPGYKDTKAIKLDNHLGAEVVLDDAQLKTYSVHRVYVVGDRLYHLQATSRQAQKPPAEFARFFNSFKVRGAPAPAPDADQMPFPGVILRFAKPVDGKQVLTRLLKGLREERHEGKTYYRSSTGESLLGLPLAGAVPDERTLLIAPEPVLRNMLAAGSGTRSPLLDRLRQSDARDEVTGIVLLDPYRNLLKGAVGPLKALLPPNLAEAASLPDRLVSVTTVVNLGDKTLLKVALEADSDRSVEVLDSLAFKGLGLARQLYPDLRPSLVGRLPAEVVQPVLAVADQLFGGIQVTREGKRLIVRLEKPEDLGKKPPKDLIASAGFNDARGLNSNPVPGAPYPLDTPNRVGGAGEPGWAELWPATPAARFQTKVVFEGDGALYLTGSPNVGPNYGRQLARAQTGRFQVEYHLQVPAGSSCGGYVWKDPWKDGRGGPFASGPNWNAGGGKFSAQGLDTGFKCLPGRWYKVTLRINVATQTWEFFVDDRRFEASHPLGFRAKVEYLDVVNFLVEGGVYIDALRVTRLPDVRK